MHHALRRRFVLATIAGFVTMFVLDWTGVTGMGFPKSWVDALIELFDNLIWTALFAVVNYFLIARLARRASGRDSGNSGSGSGVNGPA